MSKALKTGILLPPVTQAYERSQIVARVENDLHEFRVAQEQRRLATFRRSGARWITCRRCLELGFKMPMRERMLEAHALNHRIHQALGSERAWIEELRRKMAVVHARFAAARKAGRLRGQLVARQRGEERAVWLWQRTVLKMRDQQRRRLAWVTIRTASPIWIIPDRELETAVHMPEALSTALSICRSIAGRLQPGAIALSGWLAPAHRRAIQQRYAPGLVVDRIIALPDPVRFVVWEARS